LWRSRFTAAPVAAEHVVDTLVYVEQAPLRSGLVQRALDYPWSSARFHVRGGRDPVVSTHPALWTLGNTPFDREAAHARLLENDISDTTQDVIESTALKGWGWASVDQLQKWDVLGRRTSPRQRGRPPGKVRNKIVPN
jgi:putative transposase